ncbi:MAG: hypothetical protein EOS18_06290 [Mesorhizobium sp.]|nr:MAG: hypothetical protein EOS18_06290 [Mesorhizobium sp.]
MLDQQHAARTACGGWLSKSRTGNCLTHGFRRIRRWRGFLTGVPSTIGIEQELSMSFRNNGLHRAVYNVIRDHTGCSGIGAQMENFLNPAIQVPLDNLWPDPNNPRLALEMAPGYQDPKKLFDTKIRDRIFENLGESAYNVADLVQTIIGQGWMAIDNVIVWQHPKDPAHYIVVEGNRRRLALETIRAKELPKERAKLAKLQAKKSDFSTKDVEEQQQLVSQLERIVADTASLAVVPLDASGVEELNRKLPRLLAVRHITGAKEWGNYAEDLWLLNRFHQVFNDKHPKGTGFFWDGDVLKHVANEASISHAKAKWQLKAASWFSHFRTKWEDELPDGEEFGPTDYYLFEQISKKPWVRQQFGVGEDASALPHESENALFEWVFKLPRGRTADDNPNKFFRHENVTLWDQIHRYDEKNGTSFAMRFDIDNPDEAPTMSEIEAAYLSHKAQRKPHAVINDLLHRLGQLTAEQLASEGESFRSQLEQLRTVSDRFLKMIDATAS